ncbi:hypothetical protein ACFY05_32055 [Microtetraspora fusca]|uniref:Uncharacterized protein n=1 Tax=Microtetraspora fusca TaxID=1997 RepID=A0ABW6VDR7_MICFU
MARRTTQAHRETTGTRLAELRRSNAAGRHDSRPRRRRSRGDARRGAIADSSR